MTTEKCVEILDNWVSRNESQSYKEIDYHEEVALFEMMKNVYFMLKEKGWTIEPPGEGGGEQ